MNLIAGIFIKEEWWDRLLELVKMSPDLKTIDNYEKYLSKNYTNEIVELYANEILSYMENNMGRAITKMRADISERLLNLEQEKKQMKLSPI